MGKGFGFWGNLELLVARVGVRVLFKPKRYFVNKAVQGRTLHEPVIIISNHVGVPDGPLIDFAFKNDIYFLAAKDVLSRKTIDGFFQRHNPFCVPLERHGTDTSWIHLSVKLLSEGKSVCIFPEGRFGDDPAVINDFHTGFALLAYCASVPVLPVYIGQKYNYVFGKRQEIIIGEPIKLPQPEGAPNEDYFQNQAREFKKYISELEGELKRQKALKNKKNKIYNNGTEQQDG